MGCLSIQDSKNRPKHTKNLCLSQSLVPNGQPVLFFFWAQNQGMSILLFIAQFLIEVYWEPWDCPINQCLINQCWVVLMLLLLLLLWLLPLLLLLLLLLLLRVPLVFQQIFGKWPFADWCFCVVCVTYGSIAGISRTSFPWSCALPERVPARLRANLNVLLRARALQGSHKVLACHGFNVRLPWYGGYENYQCLFHDFS